MAGPTLQQISIAVAIILTIVRSANAYLLSTFFQPDEYYQSLEPAWQLAFGPDSGAWITWEWREHLRSALHPVMFSAVYKAADSLSQWLSLTVATRAEILIAAPKVIQVPIAAAIDFYTWRLALLCSTDQREAWTALLLSLWSPWQWYVSTRTFSNTLETMLTVVALAYWPWSWSIALTDKDKKQPIQKGSVTVAVASAASACLLRPTNVILWVAILFTAFYNYGDIKRVTQIASKALIVGAGVLALSVSIDRAYYGTFVLPQLQFLYFNVVQSVAAFYGRNRIDYYFTEGIPLLLTTALPFGVIGLWQASRPFLDKPELAGYHQRQNKFMLAIAAFFTVLVFSGIAHKEVRFIYPILPILHVLAARPVAEYFTLYPVEKNKLKVALACFIMTINMYIIAYTVLIHQRGVIDVVHFLRHEAETNSNTLQNITVGFLMPCHSTPWRSHLVHPEISAWALTCEPPLNVPLEWREYYLDEADIFYESPGLWVDKYMVDHNSILEGQPVTRPTPEAHQKAWPDYLVHFEHLESMVNGILDRTRYTEHTRFFNTHWHDDWRRRGDVIVQKLDTK